MTFIELVGKLAAEKGLSRSKAEEEMKFFFGENGFLQRVIEESDEIKLLSFGSFKKIQRKERAGVNPQTGDKITIPARKALIFKASKKIKEVINN